MIRYTPSDWYWIVGSDSTKAWSSARAAYVTADDARLQAWLAAGGVLTRIASWAELVDVLTAAHPAGLPLSLAATRYAHETAGVMFALGDGDSPILFPTDRNSQAQYAASYGMARDGLLPKGIAWKIADGTFVQMTAANVQALAVKVHGYVAACFEHEAELAAAAKVMPDTDFSVGWPSSA